MNAQRPQGLNSRAGWRWIRIGRWRWQVNVEFASAKFLPRLAYPEALMRPPARLIRSRTRSGTTEVARVVWPELSDTPLVVKRYHARNLWQRIRALFRIPRARKAFELGFFLEANGVPTAVPVAALGSRWPWQPGAFLITREVRPAFRLYEFNQTCQDPRKRRVVIKAFARLMAQLHNLGLVHTDPSLTNFLLTQAPDRTWRVLLVDLDGLRRNRWFRWRRELKNLERVSARAATSSQEQLVFLASYCRARRPPLPTRQVARHVRPLPLVSRPDVTPSSVPIDHPSDLLAKL